jgi:hypothetical protein
MTGGELFLPGLPVEIIQAAYLAAPGNEIESGKFASSESSAALVANTFGLFLDRPACLPPLPGTDDFGWPAENVTLEGTVRFPWSAGRHPCLDVLVTTETALIGIESKRYEPFRSKGGATMSDAYWRPVWGSDMRGYEHVRDSLRDRTSQFRMLDVAQLVKHAFGLRTAVHRAGPLKDKRAILFYLFSEPRSWPARAQTISQADHEIHQNEISKFAKEIAGNEVTFLSCSYHKLLTAWHASLEVIIRTHALAVRTKFDIH